MSGCRPGGDRKSESIGPRSNSTSAKILMKSFQQTAHAHPVTSFYEKHPATPRGSRFNRISIPALELVFDCRGRSVFGRWLREPLLAFRRKVDAANPERISRQRQGSQLVARAERSLCHAGKQMDRAIAQEGGVKKPNHSITESTSLRIATMKTTALLTAALIGSLAVTTSAQVFKSWARSMAPS